MTAQGAEARPARRTSSVTRGAKSADCPCGCGDPVIVPSVLRGRRPVYARAACRKRAYRRRQKTRRSLSVDWYTPPDVFAEGLKLTGVDAFDLDPCTSRLSPIWALVQHHFTVDDNGLEQYWDGRVWVNP